MGHATQQGPAALGSAARLKTLKRFSIFFIFLIFDKKIVIDLLRSAGKYTSATRNHIHNIDLFYDKI
jgi:hypothetical protein